MYVNDLIIEITRKCNMACDHCLRGDVENKNIDIDYVQRMFSQIDYINTLTITGGEPSLQPKLISKIVDMARMMNVTIENFYMVTNAKRVTPLFIKAVRDLYDYCSDNEISGLNISNDGYHDLDLDNVDRLKRDLEDINYMHEDRMGHELISYKDHTTGEFWQPLPEGKADDNQLYSGDRETKFSRFEVEDDTIHSDGDAVIYLNAIGDVLSNCNLSYETQRNKNLILGSVKDDNFILIEAVKEYNINFLEVDEYESITKEDFLELELALV